MNYEILKNVLEVFIIGLGSGGIMGRIHFREFVTNALIGFMELPDREIFLQFWKFFQNDQNGDISGHDYCRINRDLSPAMEK
jgi:hypothetical protein